MDSLENVYIFFTVQQGKKGKDVFFGHVKTGPIYNCQSRKSLWREMNNAGQRTRPQWDLLQKRLKLSVLRSVNLHLTFYNGHRSTGNKAWSVPPN